MLTQYGREGSKQTFSPRPDRERAQSLTVGPCTVDQVTRIVAGRFPDIRDRVRHTTAGRLRAAGFVVMSSPTARNPDHVSVYGPDGTVPWDDDKQAAFDMCFQEGAP